MQNYISSGSYNQFPHDSNKNISQNGSGMYRKEIRLGKERYFPQYPYQNTANTQTKVQKENYPLSSEPYNGRTMPQSAELNFYGKGREFKSTEITKSFDYMSGKKNADIMDPRKRFSNEISLQDTLNYKRSSNATNFSESNQQTSLLNNERPSYNNKYSSNPINNQQNDQNFQNANISNTKNDNIRRKNLEIKALKEKIERMEMSLSEIKNEWSLTRFSSLFETIKSPSNQSIQLEKKIEKPLNSQEEEKLYELSKLASKKVREIKASKQAAVNGKLDIIMEDEIEYVSNFQE